MLDHLPILLWHVPGPRHLPDGFATTPEQRSGSLEVSTKVMRKMHGVIILHVRHRGSGLRAYLEHASV